MKVSNPFPITFPFFFSPFFPGSSLREEQQRGKKKRGEYWSIRACCLLRACMHARLRVQRAACKVEEGWKEERIGYLSIGGENAK